MARISKSEKVPKQLQDTFNAIVALTETCCTLTFRTLFRSSEAILAEPSEEIRGQAIHGAFQAT